MNKQKFKKINYRYFQSYYYYIYISAEIGLFPEYHFSEEIYLKTKSLHRTSPRWENHFSILKQIRERINIKLLEDLLKND